LSVKMFGRHPNIKRAYAEERSTLGLECSCSHTHKLGSSNTSAWVHVGKEPT